MGRPHATDEPLNIGSMQLRGLGLGEDRAYQRPLGQEGWQLGVERGPAGQRGAVAKLLVLTSHSGPRPTSLGPVLRLGLSFWA